MRPQIVYTIPYAWRILWLLFVTVALLFGGIFGIAFLAYVLSFRWL